MRNWGPERLTNSSNVTQLANGEFQNKRRLLAGAAANIYGGPAMSGDLMCFFRLLLRTILQGRRCYDDYSTDEETEAQRS